MLFEDRVDAGRALAARLASGRYERPIVLALPRGGVPVGWEVAQVLPAELDVVIARKIGAPSQPELGVGALAPGVRVLDQRLIASLGISGAEIDAIAAREEAEIERRLRLYRGDRPPPQIAGRDVILVDDGLATGVTVRAAARYIRAQSPRSLLLAVPVCAPESAEAVRSEVSEVVCLYAPEGFAAVGAWYRDFTQTADSEVVRILEASRSTRLPSE